MLSEKQVRSYLRSLCLNSLFKIMNFQILFILLKKKQQQQQF